MLKVADGGTSKELINALKTYCETFGIPEELSSDGGPQFTSYDTKKFMEDWGIHHRLSSAAYPHSNCRAELAVKSVKRLITSNVGSNGTLQTDEFRRAMLQYKNTPDSSTKLSPAQIVFGRSIRDFTPMSPNNYHPAKVWTLTAEKRESALAKRHSKIRERLNEHTRVLSPLKIGDTVYVQNQTGNYPRKWDKSGKVIEVKQFDQYNIKIDGSGRVTLRNRKFLRKFTPYEPSMSKEKSVPEYDARPTVLIPQKKPNNQSSMTNQSPNLPMLTPMHEPPISNGLLLQSNMDRQSTSSAGNNIEDMVDNFSSESPTQISNDSEETNIVVPNAVPTENNEPNIPLRRSTRIRFPNVRNKDYFLY